MNLYFRLILVLIKSTFQSIFSKRIDALEPSRLRFHVLPNDLDLNVHMNNGRYLSVMDLGRTNMIFRNGLISEVLKRGYAAVLGSIQMRYRIQLAPFQAYDLESRIVCWDDKWAYMEQRFIIAKGPKAGAVAAIALLKGGFYDPKTRTTVPMDDVVAMLGDDTKKHSPEFPDYVQKWIEAEEELRSVTA